MTSPRILSRALVSASFAALVASAACGGDDDGSPAGGDAGVAGAGGATAGTGGGMAAQDGGAGAGGTPADTGAADSMRAADSGAGTGGTTDGAAGSGGGDAAAAGGIGTATGNFSLTFDGEPFTVTECGKPGDGKRISRVTKEGMNDLAELSCANATGGLKIRFRAREGTWTDWATALSELRLYVEIVQNSPYVIFNTQTVTSVVFKVTKWDSAAAKSAGSIDITLRNAQSMKTAKLVGSWQADHQDCRNDPNPFCGI